MPDLKEVNTLVMLNGREEDTVLISVGMESSFLFLTVTNICGTSQFNKLYPTSTPPDQPILRVSDSEYEGYKLLSVSNTSSFRSYQWYRDEVIINSSQAREPEYVAYLPGLYTVGVSNSDGCELIQDVEDGLEIRQANQDYSVYTGQTGRIVVLNHTNNQAVVKIYDFSGKLHRHVKAEPGYNEISFRHRGAFMVQVTGSGTMFTGRIFAN